MANRQCSDEGSHGIVIKLGQAYILTLWGPKNSLFSVTPEDEPIYHKSYSSDLRATIRLGKSYGTI